MTVDRHGIAGGAAVLYLEDRDGFEVELVAPLAAEGYRKAVRMMLDVAKGYAARGERHLRADNPEAAWADLLLAESLNPTDPIALRLRGVLAKFGLAVCRAALAGAS